MNFIIYNTLSRKKEEFIPITEKYAGLYTCGPTVYDYAHIGNLRTYIFEDVLKKSLEYCGLKVKHVMNITDVGHLQSDSDSGEDKMTLGALRENKSPWEIARYFEEAFFADCTSLNITRPDVVSRATEHIEDMIALIRTLEEKGYTYISNGNVYFEIERFKDYNKLAGLSMEELEAGNRVEVDPNKKNPLDFVLWFTNSKFKNHIMQWDSPWGTGFPGWHVECSAMSLRYLGERIDIHCGGVDHIPVHHTNEIAQSEAALCHKWVNYWLHGEFLVLDNGKMSKSSGDFLTVSRLKKEGFSPLDYRFFCLLSRYRKQLVFSFESLKDAQNSYRKLKSRIAALKVETGAYSEKDAPLMTKYREEFRTFISDDLNTANAITVVYDVLKDDELSSQSKMQLIEDFDRVLCLDMLKDAENAAKDEGDSCIDALIEERNTARRNKDWTKADEIRQKLKSMNIEITDSREGTSWKRI